MDRRRCSAGQVRTPNPSPLGVGVVGGDRGQIYTDSIRCRLSCVLLLCCVAWCRVLPESVVHSLNGFRHQQRLKKAVARVLAHRMTEADTEHLEFVFKKFDVNGDGQLGREEIEEMMKHIGKSSAEAKDLLATIDDNGDGVISKEEFATALEVNRLGHNRAEIKASFDLFDVDHDGFVTAKEIEKLCDFMRPEQVKQLISDVDTNKDGQINFAEWLAAMKDIGQKKSHKQKALPSQVPESDPTGTGTASAGGGSGGSGRPTPSPTPSPAK